MASMTIKDVVIQKTYFRNDPRFGRTTTLVVKATGEKLGEWMGCMGKAEAFGQYERRVRKG